MARSPEKSGNSGRRAAFLQRMGKMRGAEKKMASRHLCLWRCVIGEPAQKLMQFAKANVSHA